MPKRLIAWGIASGMLLAGCSGAPVSYHTLVPVPMDQGVRSQVRVERVSMPPQVDRPQLVVRQGSSGLVILETQWWGANLVDEFRSALQDQLGGNVGGSSTSRVRVDVQRFDSVPGKYSLIDVRWRLQRAGAAQGQTCRSIIQTPADNTVESLVQAHQQNLRKLAEQMATANRTGQQTCPAQGAITP
ncbi:membrane integrity-associated transporter subunit PqiC [Pseudomonas sp. BP01]|uniref:PqiC family protein n=1 Tax=Pseudomonas sp. BP01 TaxID=2976152 RepID=UPI001FA9FB56|nr:PqiC family protein [Pseudomonas sp. BP01]